MTADPASADPIEEGIPTPIAGSTARRGGNLYFFATIWGMAAALLRYVVLARLLGPTQLGIAATIVVTSAFFDQISDTGSDRFLVQDAAGDEPRVQSLVQLVFVSRGLLIALALVLLAGPIAAFYKTPPLARGLMIFAAAPLIMGFMHMDNRRLQRAHDFRTVAVMTIAGEVCSVVGTVVAAYLTRNFTAILFGLISRSVVMVFVSHILAERKYRVAYSKEIGPRLGKYARPLVLTGIMLFIGSQSDRVVIGRQLGVTALGHYSAVLLLVYYPATVFLNCMHVIFVPLIADHRDDTAERDRVIDRLGAQVVLLAMAMMIGFALVAPIAVPLLYGAHYREPALILCLIGILQIWRFLVVAPTTAALSIGASKTVLIGNLMRLLVFPGAFIGFRLIGGLAGVVAGFAVGEAIAVIIETVLINRDTRRHLATGLDRLGLFLVACGAIPIAEIAWSHHHFGGTIAASVVTAVAAVWLLVREAATVRETLSMSIVWLRRFAGRIAPRPRR